MVDGSGIGLEQDSLGFGDGSLRMTDDDERMTTMLIKSSTVTGGVQRKEHTVEPKPTASSAQKFFYVKRHQ